MIPPQPRPHPLANPLARPSAPALALVLLLVLTALTVLQSPGLRAETVSDRKAAVLNDRSLLADDDRWIYDDYERAFAEGRRTGKPVLVVLRCIPCLACIGIDSALLLEHSSLSPLLDRFVCARVVNGNALDLARFEFDFDLSFSALVFHGDGTLVARYGSWSHQKNPANNATDGLRDTLEKALALHAALPGNKAALAGKQPRPGPYKTPIEMPTLSGRYKPGLDWEGQVVQSCVHCHQIGDGLRAAHRGRKERLPSNLIYPYPGPEALGLHLAPSRACTIESVTPSSPAARAGFQPGDAWVAFDGQPVVSAADVAWVLHHASDRATLAATVQRKGQPDPVTLRLALDPGWRSASDISRRVGTWSLRAMALGGMQLEDLPDPDRTALGLDAGSLALRARHVGEYNEHAAAKRAGFRPGDILIAVAGASTRETESALIGRLLSRFEPGDRVRATVLRNNERLDLEWPIQ